MDSISINIPQSWDDITVGTFEKLEEYYSDKDIKYNPVDVLHILTDKSKEFINDLPIEVVCKLIEKLSFLDKSPNISKPVNEIELDGEKYHIAEQNEIRTGEYIASSMVIAANPHDYSSILAIMCRKDGEPYDAKFENEMLPKRVEKFKNAPITKVLPLINFFLTSSVISEEISQLYSLAEDAFDNTLQNIETFRKNGRISALSTLWLKRKLKRLRKHMPHM